ncbi:MAG: hypothetical protein CMN30_18720 [Sandaracinus sp.]|nr:hypothetical protein [Sandaracinus sp.]
MRFLSFGLALLALGACADDRRGRDGTPFLERDAGVDAGAPDLGQPQDFGPLPDGRFLPPDAACATASAEAMVERLPVDIIWVVDNSVSMQPAIDQVTAGLNDFAALIAASGLDYRVIMLSLRGRGELSVGGRTRYGVCIPQPLAGDGSCGDGERFFQVDVDIHSTQPIEQILGTLGQANGYREGDQHGSAPWRDLLREGASKTFVVVTDDNSRTCALPVGSCSSSEPPLTATSLEDFPGGPNPFNSRDLGPGILTATYGDLFEDYLFSGIYGWGSAGDPDQTCTYDGGDEPPSPGQTYTALVERTGGVRAQICDGASAWSPFFASVATAVTGTSRIDCELALPPPPDGMSLDVDRVNVTVRGESGETTLPRVEGAAACTDRGGWYYDDPVTPGEVILCPTSCDAARDEITTTDHGVSVLFGCDTILI